MNRSVLFKLLVGASLITASVAQAQFVVFDPNNFSQNILTAARSLEQINNQVTSLQHESQMLTNEARNLTSLPYSSLQQLQTSLQSTQQLIGQAQNIAYSVQQVDNAFQTTYSPANASQSDQMMIANARQRWQNAVGSLQDAMRVQAGVVGNIDVNAQEMSALVGSSQSAVGALQATQAGNQILALQSRQLSDLTAAFVAQGRAQSLQLAQQAAAQDQAKEQMRRFLTPGVGYQPTNVRMFQ
jgi:P-type conjugative transfer protein TrbJ